MNSKDCPKIKIGWNAKDHIPTYETPTEYYKIYNLPKQLVFKYPIP